MNPTSSYSHMMHTGNFDEPDCLKAKIVSDRRAMLDDGTKLRVTPKGQKRVPDLVFKGDIIKHEYDNGLHEVVAVNPHQVYGLPVYTLVFVLKGTLKNKDGEYEEKYFGWSNEYVAQDGRILPLFEACDESEIFVVEKARSRQLQLFTRR